MRKIYSILIVAAAAFSIQPIFATNQNASNPCETIAQACLSGGFDTKTPNKEFWQDCMKPILLGQNVPGVTIDPTTAKNCRVKKINQLKEDLKEFQKVS